MILIEVGGLNHTNVQIIGRLNASVVLIERRVNASVVLFEFLTKHLEQCYFKSM